MSKPQKFLFETSFDPEEILAREQAISVEHHKKCLEEEYSKGFTKGFEEAQQGIDARNTEQLRDINARLLSLLEEQTQHREKSQVILSRVLQKCLEKLFPTMANQCAIEEVLTTISKAFDQEPPSREIEVFVHPETVEALRGKLSSTKEGEIKNIHFKVQAAPDLDKSDCRLMWEGGGLERLSSRIFKEIDECLERLGATTDLDPIRKSGETKIESPPNIEQKNNDEFEEGLDAIENEGCQNLITDTK